VTNGVRLSLVFLGLGLFCIIEKRTEDRGERAVGGEVKSKKGKGKSERPEDGFAAGREIRFAATLRLAVLGVWAVYGYDEAPQLLVIGYWLFSYKHPL